MVKYETKYFKTRIEIVTSKMMQPHRNFEILQSHKKIACILKDRYAFNEL